MIENNVDLRQRLKTVHAYAVTPFQTGDLLAIDEQGFLGNLRFLVDRGAPVIVVGGGTGEIDALRSDELESLARLALEGFGEQVLVIPSLPGNTGAAVDLAQRYQRLGAGIALALPPYQRGGIPDDLTGVLEHLRLISAAAPGLALMPYNTQGWGAEFFERLATIDAVIGIKDPCFDDHPLFRAIQRLGDRFVWIGNKRHDPGVLHLRYQAGIEGFTAGFINFLPEPELELERLARQRDWQAMVPIQRRLAALEGLRNQYGESMIKAALDAVGLSGGAVRPPRVQLSAAGRAALHAELRQTWGFDVPA
ncbi:MAG: dihydrodipicolinate synthase family protein [bacterium]|nr:dihydrodipicolinate synthase family protein [bacterium]